MSDAGLTDTQVEALILKFLFNTGEATGRLIADQTRLPFKLIETLLRQMKHDQLVVYKGAAPMNDYTYTITDMGRERGRREFEHCTYFGAAPVSLEEYIASVKAQSIEHQQCNVDDLRRAFADLLLSQRMLNRLGPAVNSGRGLFLYGAPGNGKTSIAERITKAFGQTIWIPRALGIDGDILRLFDPSTHEEMPLEAQDGLLDHRRIDKRWVRIRRPTIVVGGELRMENLEITLNGNTNISEAPLQMKSNCGVLVIDDFGRQRIRTDELLNRWIVPLEKRYDFLNLASGKKIQVPFDQLIIFSTNLEPKDLVDDAFLRRIPYKIDVQDPSEDQFRELFQLMAPKLGFVYHEDPVDYLIDKHYRAKQRPFRCCQPRDLLLQVKNFCAYQGQSPEMTRENFDFAVENYFAIM
ncbi:MAG: AAA family ATPase [Pirellulales bacterium]|nr:AAA family ATPase [Pirellulales bacterium]